MNPSRLPRLLPAGPAPDAPLPLRLPSRGLPGGPPAPGDVLLVSTSYSSAYVRVEEGGLLVRLPARPGGPEEEVPGFSAEVLRAASPGAPPSYGEVLLYAEEEVLRVVRRAADPLPGEAARSAARLRAAGVRLLPPGNLPG